MSDERAWFVLLAVVALGWALVGVLISLSRTRDRRERREMGTRFYYPEDRKW